MGAEETKVAFKVAGDFALRVERPSERFPALYGQVLWNLIRGDIYTGKDIAVRFLRKAEADGGNAEVGVAHRLVGLACALLGDLTGARSNLELALSSYVQWRDREIKDKFGQDTGVVSRTFLAHVSWLSGDFQRAHQLIKEAMHLASDLGHLPSAMNALTYKSLIDCSQNNPERVAVDAETLSRISREHGLQPFILFSDKLLCWVEGRLSNARTGAEKLRKAIALSSDQGNRVFIPQFFGLLAELEVADEDPARALETIKEGLTAAREGGQLYADSFLFRLYGEILLMRDPSATTPAEDAYRTAIAVAREQGARSYELRGSPNSTNRPIGPPRPTPSLRLRSKAFRRRRKCPRSPKRKCCSRVWRRPASSGEAISRSKGMAGMARTPVLPEATPVGPLSAHLCRSISGRHP